MPSVIQPTEFFVVGGPVPPERPCYVEREADLELGDALRARRTCCVLGARALGTSSLLQRAARTLRAAGALVAIVDLEALVEEAAKPGSGACALAERIATELDLGVDVGAWWRAKEGKRLVEFFWEVVLTNTTAPIFVLLDELDSVLELPLAAELLAAVADCHARRAREPDFTRFNFVLAGCASRRALAAVGAEAVLADAQVIEPKDFSVEQAYRLAVPFGGDQLAQALMDRIWAWTGGHPYLTQRVARGVARKGGRLEDVEHVVREQLLAPGAADRDPALAHARAWLGDGDRASRRAAKLLRKVCGGGKVVEPADAAVAECLWLSGTVRVDSERRLRARNRIVKELVAAGWLKAKRSAVRWVAAAALVLVALAAGVYWYTQRLPVADIATLTNAAVLDDAEAAYRRLRGLPGFVERADALWLAALARQSAAAHTLAEAMAADSHLRQLPNQEETADRLLSEFWLRRARQQAHAEQRDAAILLAQRAAALRGAPPAAAAYLAELVGDDYAMLERSLRLGGSPEYWHMGFADGTFVSIDADLQAARVSFGAAAAGAVGAAAVKLTALQHAALARELVIEGEGTAGDFELSLSMQHAAAAELLVTLRAPSGATAAVTVPQSDGASLETFRWQASPGSPLAQLADEGLRGVWRLTVVDRGEGNTGFFGGWGLAFGDNAGRDDPAEPVAIPDPTRTAAVNVQAVENRAIAWPVSPGVVGTVALWNLATGLLEHDFALPAAPRYAVLDPTGARVLAATDRELRLWNAASGALLARIVTETEFVLPPVFSADGGYVAIAERVDGASPLYSVLRSADASLVATLEGAVETEGWELGPGGRYLALQGPETTIRVVETRRGGELGRFAHAEPVDRILHASDGTALLTVDRAGAITAWPLTGEPGLGRPLGRTVAVASVSASADAQRLAFARSDGAISVLDVFAGAELRRLRLPRAEPATRTQLSPSGTDLVTQSGAELEWWRLPAEPAEAAPADGPLPTVVAIDRTSDVIAVGLASGQVELGPVATAGEARESLAFFGHRGPVTAVAVNGARAVAVSGGNDGIVRIWDVASGAPTGTVAQPIDAPIAFVALSGDGLRVASAAGRTVRVANAADGRVTAELQFDGEVTALAFSPDSARIAAGDVSGAVRIAARADPGEQETANVGAGVTALVFAPEGSRLYAAATSGAIAAIAAQSGAIESTVRRWSQPARWIERSPDASTLLAATDSWLHALDAADLAPLHSRLVKWPAESAAFAAISATSVGFAGVTDGGVVSGTIDLRAEPDARGADTASLVARDWAAAFGLQLNDNGEPVSFDP